MSKSVTPLESFTHLIDNVPVWLARLDNLTVQVAEQNARFIQVSQHSEQLRKKNNSTESLRPINDNLDEGNVVPNDVYAPPDPSYRCLAHASRPKVAANHALIAAEIRRKRKPGSNDSHASGHARYRTKSMVIVYYDSAIQDAFDSLVRSIAGARNTLRKGKISASFKTRLETLGVEDPCSGATVFKMTGSKMITPSLPADRFGPDRLKKGDRSCFEDADQDLETAQNLCEVAAHQFLRDGDCRPEIDGTRKKFQHCLEVAKKEIEQLQAEEPEGTPREPKKEPPKVARVEKPAEVPVVLDYMDEKMESKMQPEPLKQINLAGTGTIEIDEGSDSESVQIDLSTVRRTQRI
ncbi:hypothetical protein ACLMJK_003330 [Lecanora helva]